MISTPPLGNSTKRRQAEPLGASFAQIQRAHVKPCNAGIALKLYGNAANHVLNEHGVFVGPHGEVSLIRALQERVNRG